MVRALPALNLGGADADKTPITEVSICRTPADYQDGSATVQPEC